jgi:hypothetical protein
MTCRHPSRWRARHRLSQHPWRAGALLAGAAALLCTIGASVGFAAASPGRAATMHAGSAITEARAEQIGLKAYEYGIPLMEFVRQAKQQTSVTVPNTLSDAPLNELGSARKLASATRQVIVQPNLDTLYTMGHLDLSRGPLVLHVPAVSDHRYYSFEFLDPYTNVFHYVGTRTTGDGAGNYAIVGPSFHGALPRGVHRITSRYQRVWLVGRTRVTDASDLNAVHRVQNGYKLIPLADYERIGLRWSPPRPHKIITQHKVATIPTGLNFYDQLGTALAKDPPPARDAKILRELQAVGVGPGLRPSDEHLSAAVLTGLKAAAAGGPSAIYTLRTKIALKSIHAHNGWFVPPSDTGSFGTDYAFRAVVALYGIAANRPAEAIYIVGSADQTGTLLSGANRYVLTFPARHLPPARYFWSLTMYNQDFYLVNNPIHRDEIGNLTKGVKYNANGSLTLYVQSTPPTGHKSNWLPSPSSGQFEMTLRLYGPKATALNGTYRYPPITKVGTATPDWSMR